MISKDFRSNRCFIIASGPSIKSLGNLDWLKDEVTICVNQAYEALNFDPTYICIGDRKLWFLIKDIYAIKKSRIVCGSGVNGKVGQDYNGKNLERIMKLDLSRRAINGEFSYDGKTVCVTTNVVTEVALPFAFFKGFKEIYLLGCDCNNKGYFYSNPVNSNPQKCLSEGIQSYSIVKKVADDLKINIRIIGNMGNLNIFPRVEPDSLRYISNTRPLLVIGFHTEHEEYRILARQMQKSVKSQGLNIEIVEIPSRGKAEYSHAMNWVLNCAIKPDAIKYFRKKYPDTDLLYLDSDALLEKEPIIFTRTERPFDIAAPMLTNQWVENELQSSTLYFAATEAANNVLTLWQQVQEERVKRLINNRYSLPYRKAWDQQVLQDVLPRTYNIFLPLGMEYAKIMPPSTGVEITPMVRREDAIITQWQASRKMRHIV